MSVASKIGHGLAWFFNINLDYRNETGAIGNLSRGESVFSVDSADNYVEYEPTSIEWLRSITPSRKQVIDYFVSLFPFVQWIGKYNLQWFIGDLIAGVTIGAIVVPQGMAYAQLAQLPVQFGLYSSFMGVLIYWFFATSKDITIGPVAVMSTITGNIVIAAHKKNPHIPANVVASALAIIAGSIVCFIGLVRLGWLVEFISLATITAFITGSALNILVGQVPGLLGTSSLFNTRAPTYEVIINTLKYLPKTKLDAAFGLTALAMLYIIRGACNYLSNKQPSRRRVYFFINTLRSVFVILLYTMISWLCDRHLKKSKATKLSHFKILGHVPRGFQDAGVPKINKEIIQLFASKLPSAVIVLLIEHISIAKSFGRVNNYTINPSQELVAIGVTNLLGPFLGAYPATGSFSRTAIKSKAGVRTPLAGIITAIVVLLAIYALPAVFFYIPNAALAAVIIHAVGDLVVPPNTVFQFWRTSPIDVIIFFAGIFATIFADDGIDVGIYVTVACSAAVWWFRFFLAKGRFLGRVQVHSVVGDHVVETNEGNTAIARRIPDNDPNKSVRNIFLPIDHHDGTNPALKAEHPYPGIFIYRFAEGFNYPNAGHYLDYMVQVVMQTCRKTNPNQYARRGDRPWNDPGPGRWSKVEDVEDTRPTLKAIILDFSAVNNVDITSVQHLIDVRNQLDRYAAPSRVQWHFACIMNRWTKRALVHAGFGYPTPEDDSGFGRWKPIFSVAEIGGKDSAAAAAEEEEMRKLRLQKNDIEAGKPSGAGHEIDSIRDSDDSAHSLDNEIKNSKAYATERTNTRYTVVQGMNRPFFHVDLTAALQSAISNAQQLEQKHAHEGARHADDAQKVLDLPEGK